MDLNQIPIDESVRGVSLSITSALVSAVLEWMLICMLFVDASFSYLITEFASYCQLRIPCLLCSRLDHVLGNEKPGFYWDLICHKHKLKMSSLILCHLHNNLVDVHRTCESCFFSFATVNKSNAETYRLLVGKLGAEPHCGLTQGTSGTTTCTCCKAQKISRTCTQELFQSKSFEADNFKYNTVEGSSQFDHMRDKDADRLPHVEYTKIKVTSDTESESPFSDIESCTALIREMETLIQDSVAKHVSQEPQIITLADCPSPPIKFSHLESEVTPGSCHNVESEAPLGHGLEELNWQQADHSNDVNAPPKLDSFSEPFPSPSVNETHHDESKETNASFSNEMEKEVHIESSEAPNQGSDSTGTPVLGKEVTVESGETCRVESDSTGTTELRKEVTVECEETCRVESDSTGTTELPKEETMECEETCKVESDSTCTTELPKEETMECEETCKLESDSTCTTELPEEVNVECGETCRVESDSTGTTELRKEVSVECGDPCRVESDSDPSNEIQMDSKPNKTDTSSHMAESLELGDAYKLALGTRGRQLSGRLLEQQRSMTDTKRASGDLKLLLSQISAARGIEMSLNDMSSSPRVYANSEDFKATDASAIGMQIFQRRVSLERNESNLSLDGSTICEIEGESVVDRLKRQVEHDKKIMGSLYKELEEERNASAVATNEAMAMITRLQEEKAALHMEALQYLRMMEEQAEYDGEALEKANEMLAEREKQIQDIEYELELCRNQLGDLSLSDNFVKTQPESVLKAQKLGENSAEGNNKFGIVKTGRISVPHFEEEKQYILQCLKELEEKLFIFTTDEVDRATINADFSAEEVLDPSASDQLDDGMGVSQENGGTEKNHLPRDTLVCKVTHPDDLCGHGNEGISKLKSIQSNGAELDALRDELSVMNNRLEALEAEQNFIGCSINSLEKGSEGFEFIREIALRLRELHSAQTRTRNEDLT